MSADARKKLTAERELIIREALEAQQTRSPADCIIAELLDEIDRMRAREPAELSRDASIDQIREYIESRWPGARWPLNALDFAIRKDERDKHTLTIPSTPPQDGMPLFCFTSGRAGDQYCAITLNINGTQFPDMPILLKQGQTLVCYILPPRKKD